MDIEKIKLSLPGLTGDKIRQYFVPEFLKKGGFFVKEGQLCRKICLSKQRNDQAFLCCR